MPFLRGSPSVFTWKRYSGTWLTCRFGKHYHPNPWVIPAFRERGYHVVSAAYRFLPHVSLWDVVDDSRDAYEWCKTYLEDALSKSCGEGIVTGVDIERYVVAGESVGGLLVTLAGHNFNPRPRAIAAIYPFTDPLDPYFHPEEGQPSGEFARVVRVEGHSDSPIPADPHAVAFLEQITPVFEARHRRGTASSSTSGTSTPGNNSTVSPLVAGFAALPLSGKHTPLELYEFLCQRDPRKASYAAAFRHELPPIMSPKSLREFWGTPEGWTPGETPYIHSDAMIFQYAARLMIRNGGRRELYGSDEEWRNALRNLSSQALVEHRARLTGGKLDYPPTYLIHGDADITVPAYHSEQMAAKLRRHGVVVVDKYISNAPHSFDLEISVSATSILFC